MKRTLVASNVPVRVGTGERVVDIYLNKDGDLVLEGIGSVVYEMHDDELWFAEGEE